MDHGKYGFVKLRSQFLKEWHLMSSFLCIMQNLFSLMITLYKGWNI